MLPLIIEAHNLLPPTPLFWTNDDKTIPLHRQTLWLHTSTIQWLSDTGEAYPQELREVIQPRLQKMRPPPPAKAMQPPQPPKPSRWQQKSDTQASQGSTSQDPKVSQPSPHQLAEHEKRYMELQAVVANLGQRTLVESRPTANQPSQKPDEAPAPPAPKRVDAGAHLQTGTIEDRTTKVSAQTLAEVTRTTATATATAYQGTRGGCPGYRRAVLMCLRPPRCKETGAAKT